MVQSLDDARRRHPRGGPGRVPPHNLQAEESLLGAMLLSKDAISAAVEICSADDFYKPAHSHVFEAIVALFGQGEPADPVTVAEELRRADLLDAIGGPSLLTDLQANTPAVSNAARYARIVEEHALLRRLIGVAGEIGELGYALPDDVEAALDQAESMIFEVAQRRVADTLVPLNELLRASLDHLERLYERNEAITGTPTGYTGLDELLSGLQPSALNVVGARPGAGKALALDTPVPTPDGWTTMGALRAGDVVFSEAGEPCTVTYVSPVHHQRSCYAVELDDGARLVADADHQWLAYDRPAWRFWRDGRRRLAQAPPADPRPVGDQAGRIPRPRVVTTRELVEAGVRAEGDGRPRWHIPVTGPLSLPEADLAVDPYVLGCWLGDASPPAPSLHLPDDDGPHFAGELALAGYAGPHRWRVLAGELRAAGLLAGDEKRIPGPYLRASSKQRLALLQGLMDTAGSPARQGGVVELTVASGALASQARELALSLGHKVGAPRRAARRAARRADGRSAEAWRITWVPPEVVFRLPRKAAALAGRPPRVAGRHTGRAVVAIRPVPSVPVRCITVDSPSHLYLAGEAMVPTHNTAFALGIAAHAAIEARKAVLLFSLEMSHHEVTQRLLSSEARVDSTRLRNGRLLESDWHKISHAIGRLSESPLYIDDNPNITVMEIRAKARRMKSRLGDLGVIIVDYLQLMTGRKSAENRQVEVSEISRGLKILARELETPVVALSQLSRGLEMRADKRPVLADLRESGCLPASTRLMRADDGREVTLGELVLSQARPLVWSVDDRLRLVPARLTAAFPSGVKPVFRLRLASGREVDASANHPFRTAGGWVCLDALRPGARVAVPARLPCPATTIRWPDDEVVLLAHLLGRGALGTPDVRYATADPANVRAVEAAALRAFGIGVTGRLLGGRWHLRLPSPYRLTPGRRHPLRNWLEPLGLWGAAADAKAVPEDVFSLGDEQLRLFLGHLWSAAGPAADAPGGTCLVTAGRPLALGAQRALLRLGIRSRVEPARKHGHRQVWHLRVVGGGRAADAGPWAGLDVPAGEHDPRPPAADVHFDRVVEVVPLGPRPTFDATVEGTHNFVADGVIAHNSIEQDADVVMFIYRDELYNAESPDRGTAEIIVAKHRNGPTGLTQLAFLDRYTRFANMARV